MTLDIRSLQSKVVSIDGVKYDGTNGQAIFDWVVNNGGTASFEPGRLETEETPGVLQKLSVETLEGEMRVFINSWVFRGTEGEFYPCKDSVKKAKYDDQGPADTEAPLDPQGQVLVDRTIVFEGEESAFAISDELMLRNYQATITLDIQRGEHVLEIVRPSRGEVVYLHPHDTISFKGFEYEIVRAS